MAAECSRQSAWFCFDDCTCASSHDTCIDLFSLFQDLHELHLKLAEVDAPSEAEAHWPQPDVAYCVVSRPRRPRGRGWEHQGLVQRFAVMERSLQQRQRIGSCGIQAASFVLALFFPSSHVFYSFNLATKHPIQLRLQSGLDKEAMAIQDADCLTFGTKILIRPCAYWPPMCQFACSLWPSY